jgi:RNA ligase
VSLHYEFPYIDHIDVIKPAIEGRSEFILAERPWGYVIDYVVKYEDTFPVVNDSLSALRRECGGIKFDTKGNILARPYHKFFNIGERADVHHDLVSLDKGHEILEKLDGSMIHPMKIDDAIRLSTKMGITDIAMDAESWLYDNMNYVTFMQHMISAGYTPLFEWCSRGNRIVIDYPVPRLILTGMRHTKTGLYVPGIDLYYLSHKYKLDYVKYTPDRIDLADLIAHTRALKDAEGYVIRFHDGHMVKIKADDYVLKHNSKELINLEKNVIDIIFHNKADDFASLLDGNDRDTFLRFNDDVLNEFFNTVNQYSKEIDYCLCTHTDKKDFALNYHGNNRLVRDIVFKCFDLNKTTVEFEFVYRYLAIFILKNTKTQTGVDSVRHLWYSLDWMDYKNGIK